MQLNLSGHHIEITAALRNYVESKMERLERHFDHVTNMHVVLSVEKLRQKAEATLHVSGANLFADAEKEDMYAAIDALTDKLDTQIKKHKEKLKNHHQSEGGVKAHQPKAHKEKLERHHQSEGVKDHQQTSTSFSE